MRARLNAGLPPKIMVAKVGTKNLSDPSAFADLARQVVEVWAGGEGVGVVVVSSGAIWKGWNRMNELGSDLPYLDLEELIPHAISPFLDQEELAGIGSRHLLNAWGDAFEKHKREVGQIWVTHANLSDEGERESIKKCILNYLKAGVIPIINENDIVSNKEIQWMEQGISENDRLARKVAELIDADAVLFLTDVRGVYTNDPERNPRARLYEEIASTKRIPKSSTVYSGLVGRGGMERKLEEAIQCFKLGMQVAIAGNEKDVIVKFARGESVGTAIGTVTRFKEVGK